MFSILKMNEDKCCTQVKIKHFFFFPSLVLLKLSFLKKAIVLSIFCVPQSLTFFSMHRLLKIRRIYSEAALGLDSVKCYFQIKPDCGINESTIRSKFAVQHCRIQQNSSRASLPQMYLLYNFETLEGFLQKNFECPL